MGPTTTLHKVAKRGRDKLVGGGFYTDHSFASARNRTAEVFRLHFYSEERIGPGYVAHFTRADAEKLVAHFTKYLAKESA